MRASRTVSPTSQRSGSGEAQFPSTIMLRHGPVALCLLCLSAVLFLPTSRCACTPAERASLLSFLSNVSTPADRPLSSWAANTDCCLWEGISCGGDGSVTDLSLQGRGLGGSISPSSLDGLTRLAHVNLSHNRLSGALPRDLLWSDHIAVLDVSYNLLSGQLPPPPPPLGDSLAAWSPDRSRPIRSVNVSSNRLTGELPRFWEQARELKAVNASNNSLSGPIPISPSICTVSPRLNVLDLSRNGFGGAIPPGLGNCSELVTFEAGFNNLSGPLPADLCDAVRLQRLSLPYNQLTGVLPSECISKLTNLVVLNLGGNTLRGELPGDIGKLINLEELRLNENQLSGTFPSALSNCTRLRLLDLRRNNLTGDISTVDFSPLSQLGTLDLGDNNFAGEFPASIYSCTSLTALRLSHNTLRGNIAPDMKRLQALSYLSLSFNKLEGISEALRILGSCGNLTFLLLAWNFNGEAMPDAGSHAEDWPTDAFTNLRVLSLWGCQLTGKTPSWIARLERLQVLDLSGNQLTGAIPGWLGSLPNLFYLEISDNLLSGELPSEIAGMKALQSDAPVVQVDQSYVGLPLFRSLHLLYNRLSDFPPALNFTNNSLSGTIPPGIGLLKRLHILNLSRNNFSGEIPVQLGNLSELEILNLSRNHLSGSIPPTLSRLHFLASFSVAFNDLTGPIPSGGQFNTFPNSSFEGNNDLCGPVILRPCTNSSGDSRLAHHRSLKKKILVGVILITVFGGAFLIPIILLVIWMTSGKRSKKSRVDGGDDEDVMDVEATFSCNSNNPYPPHAVTEHSDVVMLSSGDGEMRNLTISDIMKATNNFHQDNIVGCGSFGSVYKANLPDGSKLAIKRLVGDMGLKEREFAAEVEALSTAQHENLVSLKGYCVRGSFRLLVYSYMENGSLDYWLHEADGGSAALDWPARLRIARGASRGLSYIHQICKPHIIHRDIKSSNILLDEEFQAHLADFGLSRLILPQNTHVTTELVGTLGYIPPEYGQAWVATLRGDIYSFGVVLLELLTGRRPIDPFKTRHSGELVGWVQQMKSQGEQEQVFDPRLRGKGFEEEMSQVLDIASLCVNHNPVRRPTIQEVVSRLANVKVNQCTLKQ